MIEILAKALRDSGFEVFEHTNGSQMLVRHDGQYLGVSIHGYREDVDPLKDWESKGSVKSEAH